MDLVVKFGTQAAVCRYIVENMPEKIINFMANQRNSFDHERVKAFKDLLSDLKDKHRATTFRIREVIDVIVMIITFFPVFQRNELLCYKYLLEEDYVRTHREALQAAHREASAYKDYVDNVEAQIELVSRKMELLIGSTDETMQVHFAASEKKIVVLNQRLADMKAVWVRVEERQRVLAAEYPDIERKYLATKERGDKAKNDNDKMQRAWELMRLKLQGMC